MALRSPLTLQPYDYIGDSTGRPLDKGQIYIGVAGQDPEFYQVPVFLDAEMTKPIDQPIRTNDGFVDFAGSLSELYASAEIYSVKVLDKQGRKVIYKAEMMRDNLTNDALQSLNTAIGESQQAAENTLSATVDSITNNAINTVNDAINNTAIEGGVLADTFVTATANGIGAIARTQRDKNADFVHAKDFGVLPNMAESCHVGLQNAIDHLHLIGGGSLYIANGVYKISSTVTLKENVFIVGESMLGVVFDQDTYAGDLLKTPTVVETPLTVTNPLMSGERSNIIAGTFNEGDFIKFSSTAIFTARWGAVGKPYFYEAEMFEISESSVDVVTFSQAAFINCKLEDTPTAVIFTPTKNMGLKNVTLRKKKNQTVQSARGFNVFQASDVYIENVRTENYDNVGITVNRSMRVNSRNTQHIGGKIDMGICYGFAYNDGSKNCTHIGVYGRGCRHVVAAGGTGWAIPMYNTISHIDAANSLNQGSIDTHELSAFFTYSDVKAVSLGHMNGYGHRLSNVIAVAEKGAGARMNLMGSHIHYDNILLHNHDVYSAYGCYDCTFTNITLISESFSVLAMAQAERCGWTNLRLICTGASKAASNAEASTYLTTDSSSPLSTLVKNGSWVNGAYIEGFPSPLQLSYKNTSHKNITFVNCGWQSSVATGGLIYITDGTDCEISDITFSSTNPNLTGLTLGVQTKIASGVEISGLRIKDVRMLSSTLVPNRACSIDIHAGDIFMKDIKLNATLPLTSSYIKTLSARIVRCDFWDKVSLNDNLAVKKSGVTADRPTTVPVGYAYYDTDLNSNIVWTGAAKGWLRADGSPLFSPRKYGTTEQRPLAAEGLHRGFQYFDTTLGKPIYYFTATLWEDATGTRV